MNFGDERIKAHNSWPIRRLFKAEAKFEARLAEQGNRIPFAPIPIRSSADPEFQRCVGHLLDALDEMPQRPDYAFDHFFRIIDIAGSAYARGKGLSGITRNLPSRLLDSDEGAWKKIIDTLSRETPLRVHELLAKRLLDASQPDPDRDQRLLTKRAEHAFGSTFYAAFIRKYTHDENNPPIDNAQATNRHKAASLLKLYMSGRPGTRFKRASEDALNLTNPQNVPSHQRRAEVQLSLLLFTLRNERAHGGVISPFRTSKASMERYESYYFIMLASYVYALGLLAIRFSGIDPSEILTGLEKNIALQDAFFRLRSTSN